jgi:hypothetical protein
MKPTINSSAPATIVSIALMLFSPRSVLSQIYSTSAGNLIQYGTFQTWNGTLQYWSGTYGRPNVIVNDADGDGGLVMLIDQTPMSQTVSTVAGTTYQLSFFSRAPQPPEFSGPVGPSGPIGPWQVNLYLNGLRSGVFENDSQIVWQSFSMDFVATGPTTLGFGATLNAGWSLFDDVTLVAVPEPSTASFSAFVLILGWAFKKRLNPPANRRAVERLDGSDNLSATVAAARAFPAAVAELGRSA